MPNYFTNFDYQDAVSFGTATPPTFETEDGHHYYVTSDGTHTGIISEMWTYDEDNDTWVKVPTGGGTNCPDPMTRAALLALRNSGQLQTECHYTITDYSRGTVGAAEIQLHATNERTLSMNVSVATTHDNIAWSGRYDIDTNRIVELSDNLGNVVTGQEVVDTFPWGNGSLTDNIIEEAASFLYVRGSVSDNYFGTGSNVVIDTGNVFAGNHLEARSNVTVRNGDFRENRVASDATINANTTGDVDNNHFGHLVAVNITGGNVDGNTFDQASNITVRGGNLTNNTVTGDSNLTTVGGSIYDNHVSGASSLTQTVTRNLYGNTLTSRAVVTQGNLNIFQNTFATTTVNTTGSTGNGIRYCTFENGFAFSTMQNITQLDLAYSSFENNSQIAANDAQRVYLRYMTLSGYGRLLLSAGTQFDGNYTELGNNGYIQLLGGRLYVNYTEVKGVSYIQQTATVTGTNRVERCEVKSQSRIRFLDSVTGCRVYYSEVSSGSLIEHRGTSRNGYVYYASVDSASQLYTNNDVNARIYYTSATGRGIIRTEGHTGTHYMYYCTASSQGQLHMLNNTGTGARMYGVQASGLGIIYLQNGNGAGRLYYSHIKAYFYLFITLTVTRYGFDAEGRQSYTVTNPPTQGQPERNF